MYYEVSWYTSALACPLAQAFRLPQHFALCAVMFQRGAVPTVGRGTAPEVAFQDDVQDMYAESFISAARVHNVWRRQRMLVLELL